MAATDTSVTVGFIGLGIMGKAMARNIMKAGFALTAHNRSRGAVEELVREGAKDGKSAAGVAAAADIVCACVPDTPDVERVLFGEAGIAEGVRPGAVVIDFSTISASATRAFSERIAEKGAVMLDSPVSGGAQGAVAGTLTCMVGGPAAAFERALPVLRAVGKTIARIGPSGAGQLAKACNQLVIVGTMMAVSEALAIAKKAGLDPYVVREALLGGSAQSFVLQNHAKRLLDGALRPGFRAELMAKDIRLAQAAGSELRAFVPVTTLGAQMYEAFCNSGRGGLDVAALGLMFEECSGIKRTA